MSSLSESRHHTHTHTHTFTHTHAHHANPRSDMQRADGHLRTQTPRATQVLNGTVLSDSISHLHSTATCPQPHSPHTTHTTHHTHTHTHTHTVTQPCHRADDEGRVLIHSATHAPVSWANGYGLTFTPSHLNGTSGHSCCPEERSKGSSSGDGETLGVTRD